MHTNQFSSLDGSHLRIAIVASRFNQDLTDAMLADCQTALRDAQVPAHHVFTVRVPGSFELPVAVAECVDRGVYQAVICLGAIIRGDTHHDYYLANSVAQTLNDISARTRVPIIFGVLTTNNREQAEARALGGHKKGWEAGMSAIEVALAMQSIH